MAQGARDYAADVVVTDGQFTTAETAARLNEAGAEGYDWEGMSPDGKTLEPRRAMPDLVAMFNSRMMPQTSAMVFGAIGVSAVMAANFSTKRFLMSRPWWHVLVGGTCASVGYKMGLTKFETNLFVDSQRAQAARLPEWARVRDEYGEEVDDGVEQVRKIQALRAAIRADDAARVEELKQRLREAGATDFGAMPEFDAVKLATSNGDMIEAVALSAIERLVKVVTATTAPGAAYALMQCLALHRTATEKATGERLPFRQVAGAVAAAARDAGLDDEAARAFVEKELQGWDVVYDRDAAIRAVQAWYEAVRPGLAQEALFAYRAAFRREVREPLRRIAAVDLLLRAAEGEMTQGQESIRRLRRKELVELAEAMEGKTVLNAQEEGELVGQPLPEGPGALPQLPSQAELAKMWAAANEDPKALVRLLESYLAPDMKARGEARAAARKRVLLSPDDYSTLRAQLASIGAVLPPNNSRVRVATSAYMALEVAGGGENLTAEQSAELQQWADKLAGMSEEEREEAVKASLERRDANNRAVAARVEAAQKAKGDEPLTKQELATALLPDKSGAAPTEAQQAVVDRSKARNERVQSIVDRVVARAGEDDRAAALLTSLAARQNAAEDQDDAEVEKFVTELYGKFEGDPVESKKLQMQKHMAGVFARHGVSLERGIELLKQQRECIATEVRDLQSEQRARVRARYVVDTVDAQMRLLDAAVKTGLPPCSKDGEVEFEFDEVKRSKLPFGVSADL